MTEISENRPPVVIETRLDDGNGFVARGFNGQLRIFRGHEARTLEYLIRSRAELAPKTITQIAEATLPEEDGAQPLNRVITTHNALRHLERLLQPMHNGIFKMDLFRGNTAPKVPTGLYGMETVRYLLASRGETPDYLIGKCKDILIAEAQESGIMNLSPKGKPMAEDAQRNIARRFIDGDVAYWRLGKDIERDGLIKMLGDNYSYSAMIESVLDFPSEAGEDIFRLLTEDLAGYDPKQVFGSHNHAQITEWMQKMSVASITRRNILNRRLTDSAVLTEERTTYCKTVERQSRVFSGAISNLGPANLDEIVTLLNGAYTLGFGYYGEKDQSKSRKEKISISSLVDKAAEQLIKDSIVGAWIRSAKEADWEQLQSALAMVPEVARGTKREIGVATVDWIVGTMKDDKPLRIDTKVLVDAVTEFLRFNFHELLNTHFSRSSRLEWNLQGGKDDDLLGRKADSIESENNEIFEKYESVGQVILSVIAAKARDGSAIGEILAGVSEVVMPKKELHTPWLLALGRMSSFRLVGVLAVDLIQQIPSASPEFKAVMADQIPGFVYLTQAGKVVVYDTPRHSKSLGLLYESAYVAPEVGNDLLPVVEGSTTKSLEIKTSGSVVIPLHGEYGLVEDRAEVQKVVETITKRGVKEDDWEALLSDFESLKRGGQRFSFRPALFKGVFNDYDPRLVAASCLGIDPIYTERNIVRFFINGLDVVIEGRLRENGELSILGMDDSFLGEPTQLYLNNLALHLINRPFRVAGFDKEYDKALGRPINEEVSAWNRVLRGDRPKLGYKSAGDSGLIIPMTPEPNTIPAALVQVK